MFGKSGKSQKIDVPKTLSMQEIQEDLETFVKADRRINKSMIIDDLKARQDEEMNLSEWWDAWEVTKLQIDHLGTKQQRILDIKSDLEKHKEELQNARQTLIDEIENNLRDIHNANIKK